jgi:hypothetical protein
MSMTPCPECRQAISDQAAACPHCGRPMKAPPIDPICQKCGIPMVRSQRWTGGAALIVSAPIALIGLVVLFFNLVGGLIMIGLAIIIDSAGRSKEMTLLCTRCRTEILR